MTKKVGKGINLSSLMKSKKMAAIILTAAALVVAAAGFFCYAASYSAILPNVTADSVKIGGMKKDEAAELLREHFDTALAGTVTLKFADTEKSVGFAELGISVDADKTAETAFEYGREKSAAAKAFSYIGALFKGKSIEPSYVADTEKVNGIITQMAGGYETGVREMSYSLRGSTLTIDKGEGGKRVSREKALTQIEDAIGSADKSTVELKLEDAEPAKVDVDEFYKELTKPAQDAYYERRDGGVEVVDDVPQIEVDKNEIKRFFDSDKKTISLTVGTKPAAKTAEQLKKLLFRDVMGSYSSSYTTSTSGRAANVELAASRINGYILMPGEVFSYDKTIGRRTAANGYHEAGVYIGNKVEQGIGGGICQTSSTLYSAALYANLEIVQRSSHSLPVSYVPAGQDATIAEGYIDLKIKNNTEYPIKIAAVWGGRRLTCKIIGVKAEGQTVEIVNTRTGTREPKVTREYTDAVPQGYKKIAQRGAAGYTVASKRIVRKNGQVVKEEKLKGSTYNATDTIEQINPADKNTPSESLAIYTGKPAEKTPSEAEQPTQPTSTPQQPSQPTEKPEGGAESGGQENPPATKTEEKPTEPPTVDIDA